MRESDQKVIHNRDEDNVNNETDKKKKSKHQMKSTPAPTGEVGLEELIFRQKRWDLGVKACKDYFTNSPNTTSGIEKPVDLRKSPYLDPFLYGGPTVLDLNRPNPAIDSYAAEAVKEYNNRAFKDKLKLVKVKKGTVSTVSGLLYNLTFDANVLADGEGERTQTYQAKVWLKIDKTLEVTSLKLAHDAQGMEEWFWKKR